MSEQHSSKGQTITFKKEEFDFNLDTAFAPFLNLRDEDGYMDPVYYDALMNFYQAMEWEFVVETHSGLRYAGREYCENRIGLDQISAIHLA